ncbi:Sodium- and chloride-dependent transporter [Helicobacter sp. NHP21005]|uniref:sodium-dependent transporter n=1 Tax=Helicobacter felistomachi TaxID=3040201 RepID=UPI002573B7BC|nr:sodium-dependent transporter [Helicobacter sp. NHP21005]BEG57512.1 Sodium- and chloride-dependent transporter [Helicobacter sp. NHP21005]
MNNFSKLGFILAALGSSIGLGHIWRFPYMTGTSGGGGFVLLFLVLALTVGLAMLVAEMVIGQSTQTDVASAFEQLNPTGSKKWKYAGLMLFTGPIILSFYAIVLGWVFYYLVGVSFSLPADIHASRQVLVDVENSIGKQVAGLSFTLALTAWIVSRGVKDGIEKLNFVLMPLLFIIFFGLLIYASTKPSFKQAVNFMFGVRLADINHKVFMNALGQVFFALSIGIGINISYASSTEPKQNLLQSAFWVVVPGVVISLVAGLMIFTFVFEYGDSPTEGAGLIFVSLPVVFYKMGWMGSVVFVLFLCALAFAGITSTIALLEPPVQYLIDHGYARPKATWLTTLAIYLLGVILVFSLNKIYQPHLSLFNKNLFDLADFFTTSALMPLGGLASVLFVGWVIDKEKLRQITAHFLSGGLFAFWLFLIRYIAPLVILVIWAVKITQE